MILLSTRVFLPALRILRMTDSIGHFYEFLRRTSLQNFSQTDPQAEIAEMFRS